MFQVVKGPQDIGGVKVNLGSGSCGMNAAFHRSVAMRRYQVSCVLLLLLAAVPLWAGSLEFRGAGFFASPDTRVKLHRESWRYAPHLDVDGVLSVSLDGPILQPGYVSLSGGATRTEIDAARRLLVDSGAAGTAATPMRRTTREYQDGLLVRLEYGQAPPGITHAISRLIFPVSAMAGRRVRWDQGAVVLPPVAAADRRFVFLDDPAGTANRFRVELGNRQELGVQFLTPVTHLILADCRQWNEQNYHLQTRFTGNMLLLYLCLLRPDEAFPTVMTPPAPPAPPAPKLIEQGAEFSVRQGLYELLATRSGQLQVRNDGAALFTVDPPLVREQGKLYALSTPVSVQATDAGVVIVTQSHDRPFRVRQVFSQDDEGWLRVSSHFEGISEPAQTASLEVALPVATFAGKTIRAGERLITLPEVQTPAMLVNDWNAKVTAYELSPTATERVALICDERKASALQDYRKWGQTSYKISLSARDNTINYRLHFAQEAISPPPAAPDNLLRDGASFEVGPAGVQPFASYSWTEKMVAPGIPPTFDTTTAAHGAASLRLTAEDPVRKDNPRGFAFVGAVFNRVVLQRDRPYTVSAYLKADRPGMKAVLYCGEQTWAGAEWGEIPVTTEWARYAIPFHTDNFVKSGYYLTWVGIAPGCTEGTLWVDAVQLEEGSLRPFHSAPAEYGVEVTGAEKLFDAGTPCQATLRARNNSAQPLTATVRYRLTDYWGREVRAGTVPLEVPANSTAVQSLRLGVLPCGYYHGDVTMPDGAVKEIIFGVYQPQPLTPAPVEWPLACHNDPLPLVRKLGFGAVRAFDVFDFATIAPAAGAYDFTRADRLVRQARANGLRILPILGDFRWPAYRTESPIPTYALDKVTESLVNGQRVRVAWPTLAAWKAYVQALTARYKDDITEWEVMNEPNLLMTPAEYLPYLKAAYEGAKAGNPACRVVGVCATSDFAGKPGSFTEEVIKLGGAAYCDILSVHLYDPVPPERTLNTGSDRLLTNWRTLLQGATGNDMAVWHTERSYISRQLPYTTTTVNVPVEYCDEPQFLIGTYRQKAEYLIRETLLDAVAGREGRFYWFGLFGDDTSFLTNRYSQPYGLGHSNFDRSPAPELLAANGLARVLAGRSHPVRQLVREDGTRACVFTGEAGTLVALWNWQDGSALAITPGTTACRLANLFGEPQPTVRTEQGKLVLTLDGAPQYLLLPVMDAEGSCHLLMEAGLR